MHWFHKFILAWNSTCFGKFVCLSSGVYSLYTQQWYMSYRFVDSFRAGLGWKVLSWSCSKVVYKPALYWFHKFILAWNSTCFGQFLWPSSGVYSLYTQQWYMSYRFVDSFRAGPEWKVPSWSCSKADYKPVWHIPLLSVQWINSWWWSKELSETCRVSCQNKFVKSVHLVDFTIKKFVTMHGHAKVKLQLMSVKWSLLHHISRIDAKGSNEL